MRVLVVWIAWIVCGVALECPPFCVGEAGNEYRALVQPLAFRGRVAAGEGQWAGNDGGGIKESGGEQFDRL